MKQYKLIREYPGSPKLGSVTGTIKTDLCEWYEVNNNIRLDPDEIEKNPEFWEEVVEKDYEILSLVTNVLKDKENVKTYSIKRLSDGEVFTIGDKIKHRVGDIDTIKSINLIEDKIFFSGCNRKHKQAYYLSLIEHRKALFTTEDGKEVFEGDTVYKLMKGSFCLTSEKYENQKENGYCFYFSTKEKAEEYIDSKKVLFTTRDNINLYKGDKYFQISYKFEIVKCTAYNEHNFDEKLIIFSSKEVAEEYVLMNKPVLSLNDLKSLGIFNETDYQIRMWKIIKELVKSKL